MEPILSIRDLKTYFPAVNNEGEKVFVHAVDGINLDIYKGEVVGLVGESGSGKSTLAYSIMGVYKETSGNIFYHGQEIHLKGTKRPKILKKNIQLVFQDSGSSLNPKKSIGQILELPMKVHKNVPRKERKTRVEELIRSIELSEDYQYKMPRAIGGGQRQRVSIARALACEPEIVLLDEPTSALDVSVQAKIVQMLLRIRREKQLTYLFITHDLSLVRNITDRVIIFYLGKICEIAPTKEFYENPRHPYTKMLLSSIPVISQEEEKLKPQNSEVKGETPSAMEVPSGCGFRTRCPYAGKECSKKCPELREVSEGHFVSCHKI